MEDVFCIENGDIPASYVSLPEGISIPKKIGSPNLGTSSSIGDRRMIPEPKSLLWVGGWFRGDLTNVGPTKKLGGGFKYFLFSSLLGEDSHFD